MWRTRLTDCLWIFTGCGGRGLRIVYGFVPDLGKEACGLFMDDGWWTLCECESSANPTGCRSPTWAQDSCSQCQGHFADEKPKGCGPEFRWVLGDIRWLCGEVSRWDKRHLCIHQCDGLGQWLLVGWHLPRLLGQTGGAGETRPRQGDPCCPRLHLQPHCAGLLVSLCGSGDLSLLSRWLAEKFKRVDRNIFMAGKIAAIRPYLSWEIHNVLFSLHCRFAASGLWGKLKGTWRLSTWPLVSACHSANTTAWAAKLSEPYINNSVNGASLTHRSWMWIGFQEL